METFNCVETIAILVGEQISSNSLKMKLLTNYLLIKTVIYPTGKQ